jgi:hypothetical protein
VNRGGSRQSVRKSKGAKSGPWSEGSSAQPPYGSDPDHEALIDESVALFSRMYRRTVSREDAREMTERLVAFAELLNEWRQWEARRDDHVGS